MSSKIRIAVLGATGSIGKSSLDIISRDTEKFEVVLLASRSNSDTLDELSKQYPNAVCVSAQKDGKKKLLSSIAESKPDITINGISGAAGLEPSIAAINAGSNLALANKETIVMAGKYVLQLAKEKNTNIIPVDSEHSAIFHLLKRENIVHEFSRNEHEKNKISEIILTASGGPFRNYSLEKLRNVTVQDALCHPTWNMGQKITIDSASMANKGLEIIEACLFFNMLPEKIKVAIHPQSIVHSMIRLCNGVIYAQMSKPDMRHPIHDAIYWPLTAPSSLEPVDFDNLTLEFSKPDTEKFPMLRLAREAAKNGALFPCAYNAANEIAVAAFMENKIGFLDIPRITESVLQEDFSGDCMNLETILNADAKARLIGLSLF
ncbi:MAG: 1-deoxy-D-xylulose-5-phosphate reductoisomerase [Treponema sp.]|nr:1-deoxy-D-xylulose-5-phosphate reductoisomerase [Treponema sp.]MCL2236988.1 1-deoxy-D-xylulose-5-phosphate reductoisomerase [Treponema sp.]